VRRQWLGLCQSYAPVCTVSLHTRHANSLKTGIKIEHIREVDIQGRRGPTLDKL
jgi:hypothetical protein